jgi:chemotaxis response regulator CheB
MKNIEVLGIAATVADALIVPQELLPDILSIDLLASNKDKVRFTDLMQKMDLMPVLIF